MAHLSWPVCETCDGTGHVMRDPVTKQRDPNPCEACLGSPGRVKPKDWRDPVWQAPAPDGSDDGWLIDPGSDPDLQKTPTRPARGIPGPGTVPVTPPKAPYVYSREEVIALNPIRAAQGLEPLPMPEEKPHA